MNVPLVMVRDVPMVTPPELAVKFPPFSVRAPVVVTAFPLPTVVVPPLMVIEAIVELVLPTLVSTEMLDPIRTVAPVAPEETPGVHCVPEDPLYVHEVLPDQRQLLPLFQFPPPALE